MKLGELDSPNFIFINLDVKHLKCFVDNPIILWYTVYEMREGKPKTNQIGDFMGYTLILDTETTGLDKCFCYDISWVIMDMETGDIIDFKANVVEQVWHNLPLFESAYYKEKRTKYVEMMRRHEATMDKWGYIMRKLKQDIVKYSISEVYAYNSDFDDKVISYNCDWFKCNNPLETIEVYDIWGYASQFVTGNADYRKFCEDNSRFTDTGNYKGSAEVVHQFITNNADFIEEHMGLFDSEIEAGILWECVKRGADWAKHYTVNKILARPIMHPFSIKVDGVEVLSGEYLKKYVRSDVYNFKTK